MSYKVFHIPSYGCEEAERVLNGFLGNHRILHVTKEFVSSGANSYWSFCIDYLERGGTGEKIRATGQRRSKVDYKEVLDPDEFALFARLRELRKELAQSEAIPVYAVFTNEQLAQIVQLRATNKESLRSIAGMGDARIEKYSDRIIEITKEHWKQRDEESRPTV